MLMKPTAFQRESPAWANKHLLQSAKRGKERAAEEDIEAFECFSFSDVLLAERIASLNHNINQTCIRSGYECRLLMGLRQA